MKERIQKVLGNAGIASRRNIEVMVRDGRIAVNGEVIRTLPILVDIDKDKIEVDGESVRFKTHRRGPRDDEDERIYVLMNKPRGVYTTNVAQGVQKRAIDLLPPNFPRVYPVGRLDAETRGLLLLTNDGELTNRLTHPRYGVAKTYRAVVDGFVEQSTLKELEQGVWIRDKAYGKSAKTSGCHAKIVHREREKTVLDVTLHERQNIQARKILAQLGHKVRDLMRTKMGPLSLDRLQAGEFRPLTPREIRSLREFAMGRREGANAAGKPGRRKPNRAK
ncbi:MAG TPA: pseudouridine synthase [Humisphaera sp.]|jgi:23S rRNA pseudouridine2605 synthase|nr:pseudouridine synthase [Humisphaera sp.]